MTNIKRHYNLNIASTSDCIRNSIYRLAPVHRKNLEVKTAIECKNECEKDDRCYFWDMYKKNCRLLSDKGRGVTSSPPYHGALAGRKNCHLKENSPKGKFLDLESYSLNLKLLYIMYNNCKFQYL